MAFKSPAYNVISVPIEKIEPNTYNPNSVAPPELKLLYDSIREDGYTMPIVCYYDKEKDVYIIVDGFHRYRIMLDYPDIYEREQGRLPVSVIDKSIESRMASTIRHNRARGSHDKDEILRLKQITGLSSLFRDVEFGKAWRVVEDELQDDSLPPNDTIEK